MKPGDDRWGYGNNSSKTCTVQYYDETAGWCIEQVHLQVFEKKHLCFMHNIWLSHAVL